MRRTALCAAAFLATTVFLAATVCVPETAAAQPLPECTITFDGACPDATPMCGASFVGGRGCQTPTQSNDVRCVAAGDAFHLRAETIDGTVIDDAATIQFDGDVLSIRLHFNTGGSAAYMRFLDVAGEEVSPQVQSHHCRSSAPGSQTLTFADAVRTIEITTSGSFASAWIDDLTVNPKAVGNEERSWGTLKSVY